MIFEESELATPYKCAETCRVDYPDECDYWSVNEKCRIFEFDSFGKVDRFDVISTAVSGYRICPEPTVSPTQPTTTPTIEDPTVSPSKRPSSVDPRYILGAQDAGFCPRGYRFIRDVDVCQEAIGYVGASAFVSEFSDPSKGCYCGEFVGGSYFNNDDRCDHTPSESYRAICEIHFSEYFISDIGHCDYAEEHLMTMEACAEAALVLNLPAAESDVQEVPYNSNPVGCYYRSSNNVLQLNEDGFGR